MAAEHIYIALIFGGPLAFPGEQEMGGCLLHITVVHLELHTTSSHSGW